ncbi:MAG: radical SAM protein [Aquificae bacterium]|nr:radical SAM protein [Aquificota bacterium]
MGLRFVSYTYSTKDAPGMWALVLFLQGCNFRCRHCHNWKLALSLEDEPVSEEDVLKEISRNPFLDCVVISGGEPTLRAEELERFIRRLKEENPSLRVRVDTNGSLPSAVEHLSGVVDGFAVDIKAPPDDEELYAYTTGKRKPPLEEIKKSAELALGKPLTILRTVNYPWLSEKDRERIKRWCGNLGARWTLNEFLSVPDCPFNAR